MVRGKIQKGGVQQPPVLRDRVKDKETYKSDLKP